MSVESISKYLSYDQYINNQEESKNMIPTGVAFLYFSVFFCHGVFSPPIPKGVLIGCGLGCRKLALVDYLVVCGNAQILPLTT